MRARATIAPLLATAMAGALLLGNAGGAGAEPLCTVSQLTEGPAGAQVAITSQGIDADGTTVGFRSSADYLGTNPEDNNEVWTLDLTTDELTQVTSTTGPSNIPPGLSDDGQRLVFSSPENLSGQNADGNNEIWFFDAGTSTTTNLTPSTGGGGTANTAPRISGDGTTVVYTSTLNPLGTNADGSREVFYRLVDNSTRVQVTQSSSGVNDSPAIDDDASTIVLRSNRNLDTENNTDLNQELFRHEIGVAGFTQLTFTTGGIDLRGPTIDADASEIALSTNLDLAGGNADGGFELYRIAGDDGAILDQVTNAPSAASLAQASLSIDGGRVAWVLGGATVPSPEPYELFINDPGQDPLAVADTGLDLPGGTAIDETGTHIAFAGSSDLTGDNPDGGQELFLASCGAIEPTFIDVPASHPFFDEIEWMAAAGVSTGFQPGPTYQPGVAVSRAAMSAFMYRLAGSPPFTPPGPPTFLDVPANHPFFDEIEWMADEGITTGFPGALYLPAAAVTRQSMSAFMYRLAGSPAFTPPGSPTFADVPANHPFHDEIEWMADEGITTGFPGGLYKPGENVTRQAMSAFMHRLADGPGVDLD